MNNDWDCMKYCPYAQMWNIPNTYYSPMAMEDERLQMMYPKMYSDL